LSQNLGDSAWQLRTGITINRSLGDYDGLADFSSLEMGSLFSVYIGGLEGGEISLAVGPTARASLVSYGQMSLPDFCAVRSGSG